MREIPERVPRYVVNGNEVTKEQYEQWLAMMQAVIDGEKAEAEAYEAQLELIRPLTPAEVLREIIATTTAIVSVMPDEIVGRMQPYFPKWEPDTSYVRHVSLVTYGDGDGDVWRCETTHTSQASWTPDVSPSLWSKVLTSTTDVLPWEQPSSTNPYMRGDRVLWDGKVWESAVDNNVWMPGGVGTESLWIQVT